MSWFYDETIFIGLTKYTLIVLKWSFIIYNLKVITFYNLRIITNSFKLITYNLKIINWKNILNILTCLIVKRSHIWWLHVVVACWWNCWRANQLLFKTQIPYWASQYLGIYITIGLSPSLFFICFWMEVLKKLDNSIFTWLYL